MKLAYIILAHRDPFQIKRLVDRLNSENTYFLIHYDKNSNYKDYLKLKTMFKSYKNVFFMERYEYVWAEFPAIEVSINSLKKLVKLKIDFDYAILISGQHYPIKTNKQIFEFFKKIEGNSVFLNFKIPHYHIPPNSALDWIKRWVIPSKEIKKKLFFPSMFPSIIQRKFPKGYIPYWSNMWWGLSNECVIDLLDSIKNNPELFNFMKHNLAPEEIFYSTALLNNRKHKNRIINQKLVYERWIPVTFGNSCILDNRDLKKLKNSNYLFARKFDYRYSRTLMDSIDKEILIEH